MSGLLITKTAALTSFAAIVWEYVGKKHLETNFRPSVGLNFVANTSSAVYQSLGSTFAKISSFLTFVDFTKFKEFLRGIIESLWDLIYPILKTVFSPFEFVSGYVEAAKSYIGESWQIYLGSFILLSICAYLFYRFGFFDRMISKFTDKANKPTNVNHVPRNTTTGVVSNSTKAVVSDTTKYVPCEPTTASDVESDFKTESTPVPQFDDSKGFH